MFELKLKLIFMKPIQFVFTTIFALSIFFTGQSQNNDPSNKLLGVITKNELTKGNYAAWFNLEYDSYTPNLKTISALEKDLSKYTILVFMGTWCGDSRQEVPRFYKILSCKFSNEQFKSCCCRQ